MVDTIPPTLRGFDDHFRKTTPIFHFHEVVQSPPTKHFRDAVPSPPLSVFVRESRRPSVTDFPRSPRHHPRPRDPFRETTLPPSPGVTFVRPSPVDVFGRPTRHHRSDTRARVPLHLSPVNLVKTGTRHPFCRDERSSGHQLCRLSVDLLIPLVTTYPWMPVQGNVDRGTVEGPETDKVEKHVKEES